MRLFVALGIVVATLIALTVKAMVRRPPHRPPPIEEDEEAATAPAPALPEAAEPRLFARSAGPAVGPAHLFGRVLPPPGEVLGRGGLTVTADGGRRVVEALTFSDGRFDIHLPPGQYAVVASFGAWVGMTPSVPARSGGEHELTIVLGPTASLRGTVRRPAGVGRVTIRASLAGRDDWNEGDASNDDDGTFEVEGLVPGRTYDLQVEGQGARTATVRSVTAPASDLLIQVDALPVLRGAIGFPSGGDCPIGHVGLFTPDELPADDDALNDDVGEQTIDVDGDCRFELSVPEGASQMMLLAVGAGWHLEQAITIPPVGDPEPVCLNPPSLPIGATFEPIGTTRR